MKQSKSYKILIIGDGGVGKTTYVKRLRTGEFTKRYVATLGVEVHPLQFETTKGTRVLNMWDCSGREKFGGLRDGYYIKADGVIFMFDHTSKTTFNNLGKWIKDVHRVTGNIPMVVCGNKFDIKDRIVKAKEIQDKITSHGVQYYSISAKSNYNFEKPFLSLLQQLEKDETLSFDVVPESTKESVDEIPEWVKEDYRKSKTKELVYEIPEWVKEDYRKFNVREM